MGDILQLKPADIVFTLAGAGDETFGIKDGDWDLDRLPFDETEKYRSIVQRYVEGMRWEETGLFTDIYARRFAAGGRVRGTSNLDELAAQYYDRVDGLFDHMKHFGFCRYVDGQEVPLPNIHVGRDGEPLAGNNGNHRIAMAKVLNLPHIFARVQTQYGKAETSKGKPVNSFRLNAPIPAMTTDAERECYYRLAYERGGFGNIVELGAWLGASTAAIAAGMRDSGSRFKFHTYDRFRWDTSHDEKAGQGYINGHSLFSKFRENVAEYGDWVVPHEGEISAISWDYGPIAMMMCDAPKRVKQISHVLTQFRDDVQVGTVMAWQDFAHFPSYEIVACLSRLEKYFDFREAVYPGTTVVLNVKRQWPRDAVSMAALNIKTWTVDDIKAAWKSWASRLPEPMRAKFRCGAAMFMCDIGEVESATKLLKKLKRDSADEIMPKWNEMQRNRSDLVSRYRPLVQCLA